jgi:hypothetical protein
VIAACVLCACGPPPPPAYITDVESLAAGPAAEGAEKRAPSLWKKASDALEKARQAHARGDDPAARSLALEASILFKTAMAVARQKKAEARIDGAEDRIAGASKELKKFTSLRIDSQSRYLELLSFHDAQKDASKAILAAFQKDREAFSKMSEEEKETWLAAESLRLGRLVQAARSSIAAAAFLGSDKILPSETKEANEALSKAEKAQDAGWENLRPLADEAFLRAERLLVHVRALAKPKPMSNPAADPQVVERFVKAIGGARVMVSATAKGILLSFADPLDEQTGALDEKTREGLETALGAAGKTGKPAFFIEAYRSEGCGAKGCEVDSRMIAELAAAALVSAGVPESDIATHGWGQEPAPDPGHCLAEACPGGRLDVVIVNI